MHHDPQQTGKQIKQSGRNGKDAPAARAASANA